jgi:fumarylpyruvate hydrolase
VIGGLYDYFRALGTLAVYGANDFSSAVEHCWPVGPLNLKVEICMSLIFATPPVPSLAIAGAADRFPIRRIYCVGRNYVAHAREMGVDEREPPFFFTKFTDTLVENGATIAYPAQTENYHYEGELVIAIGKEAWKLSPEQALDAVYGYACGLDMTRRDLQLVAREKGRPWDMGKNFSESAVVGPIARVSDVGHIGTGRLTLKVNDVVKQDTDLELLIWSCAEIVSTLSQFDKLLPGDLIFTGTPEGVGAVKPGDQLSLTIDKLPSLGVTISAPLV